MPVDAHFERFCESFDTSCADRGAIDGLQGDTLGMLLRRYVIPFDEALGDVGGRGSTVD